MAQASRKKSEIVFKSRGDEAEFYFDQEYTTKKEDRERTPVTRGQLGTNLVKCLRDNEDDWPERRRKIVRNIIGASSISIPTGLGMVGAGIALAFLFGLTFPFAGTALMAIGGIGGAVALSILIGVSIYRGIKQHIYNKNKEKIENFILKTAEDILENAKKNGSLLDTNEAKNEIQSLLASKNYDALRDIFNLSKLPTEVPTTLSDPMKKLITDRMEKATDLNGKIAALEQLKQDLTGLSNDQYSQQVRTEGKTILNSIPKECPTFKSFIEKGINKYLSREIVSAQREIGKTLGSALIDKTNNTLVREQSVAKRTKDPAQYETFNTHLYTLIEMCDKDGLTKDFFQAAGLAGLGKALSIDEAEKLEKHIKSLPESEQGRIKANMLGKLYELEIPVGSTISLTYTAAAPAPQQGPEPTKEMVEALGKAPEPPQAPSPINKLDAITKQIVNLQTKVSIKAQISITDTEDRKNIITNALGLIKEINSLITQTQNNPDKGQQADTYKKAAGALNQLTGVAKTLGQNTLSAIPDFDKMITDALSQPITGYDISINTVLEAADALTRAFSGLLTPSKSAEDTTAIYAAKPMFVTTTPAKRQTIGEVPPAQRISAQIVAAEEKIQGAKVKPKEFKAPEQSTKILDAAKDMAITVENLARNLKTTVIENQFTELENNIRQLVSEMGKPDKDQEKLDKLNSTLTKSLNELRKSLSSQPIKQEMTKAMAQYGVFPTKEKEKKQEQAAKKTPLAPEEQVETEKKTPRL